MALLNPGVGGTRKIGEGGMDGEEQTNGVRDKE